MEWDIRPSEFSYAVAILSFLLSACFVALVGVVAWFIQR